MNNEMQVIKNTGDYVGRIFNAGSNLLTSREFMAGAVAGFALAAIAIGADAGITSPANRLAALPEAGNAPVASKTVEAAPVIPMSRKTGFNPQLKL